MDKTFKEKHHATMLKKYGSEEAIKEYYVGIARKSHKSWENNGRKPRGFSSIPKEELKKLSRKGGKKSRYGKKAV